MTDEGCVKFNADWAPAGEIPAAEIAELIDWRNRLHAAGLIGHDAVHGVGYGNISQRRPGERAFVISATQTGAVPVAASGHFTRVVDYDLAGNRIVCRGPRLASSESLTHAAIYDLDVEILAVVHVHDRRRWEALRNRVPTTDAAIAYGTPEMALEFARLWRSAGLAEIRIAVMGGHRDGLVSIGASLAEASGRLLSMQSA